MSQLDAELEHAGEETALSPKMLLLEQLRITPEKQLKPMEFLFQLYDKPCFPRRELVAITGKAKSGKTFVTSMLMACCQSRDVLAFQRIGDEPLRVLWYDTEQSDESTQDILKNRVMRMVDGDGKLFDIFNVRGVAWKERRDLLREAVTRCKPDLAIFSLGIKNNGGAVSEDVFTVSKNIKGVKLRARATGELITKSLNLEATLKKASATTKSNGTTNSANGSGGTTNDTTSGGGTTENGNTENQGGGDNGGGMDQN